MGVGHELGTLLDEPRALAAEVGHRLSLLITPAAVESIVSKRECAILGLGLAISLFVSGCGPARQEQPAASQGVALDFRSDPDPLKAGDNSIEVTVRQPDGTPVTDAMVTAVFLMPAMPAMNMPAMRSETQLAHVDGGRYRGTGQLSMAGTWNVTVTATREGEPVGRRSFSIVAK